MTRDPNRHLGFGGGGPHYCLGASLARAQLRSIFGELLRVLPGIQAQEPELLRSAFVHGVKRMDCTFSPRACTHSTAGMWSASLESRIATSKALSKANERRLLNLLATRSKRQAADSDAISPEAGDRALFEIHGDRRQIRNQQLGLFSR